MVRTNNTSYICEVYVYKATQQVLFLPSVTSAWDRSWKDQNLSQLRILHTQQAFMRQKKCHRDKPVHNMQVIKIPYTTADKSIVISITNNSQKSYANKTRRMIKLPWW